MTDEELYEAYQLWLDDEVKLKAKELAKLSGSSLKKQGWTPDKAHTIEHKTPGA